MVYNLMAFCYIIHKMMPQDIVVVNLLILMTQLLRVNVHVIMKRRESGLIVVLVFVLLIVIALKATNHTTGVISNGWIPIILVI